MKMSLRVVVRKQENLTMMNKDEDMMIKRFAYDLEHDLRGDGHPV